MSRVAADSIPGPTANPFSFPHKQRPECVHSGLFPLLGATRIIQYRQRGMLVDAAHAIYSRRIGPVRS